MDKRMLCGCLHYPDKQFIAMKKEFGAFQGIADCVHPVLLSNMSVNKRY